MMTEHRGTMRGSGAWMHHMVMLRSHTTFLGGGCSLPAGCRNSHMQSERPMSILNVKTILFPLL